MSLSIFIYYYIVKGKALLLYKLLKRTKKVFLNRSIRMHFRFRSTKATRVYYCKSLFSVFGFWDPNGDWISITHLSSHQYTFLKMQNLCSLVCTVIILISLVVVGSASNAALSGGSLIAKVGPAHRRQQQSFGSNGYYHHHHDTRRSSLGTNNLNEVQDCASPLAKNLARGAFLRIASDMYVALDITGLLFFFLFFFV